MKTADRVLEILYDRRGEPASAEELASAAQCARKSLETAMEELRRRGHRLETAPGAGVRLLRPAAMDAYLIERNLGTRRAGRHAICFAETDSTNDVAFEAAGQAGADGLVVLADYQRAGRGRCGRRWASAPGDNVLMSLVLIEQAAPLAQEALTVAAGLSVAEAIAETCSLECELSWPNDVLLEGAKVAGVLIERRRCGQVTATVIGIGINANASPPPEEVDTPAACLAERTGEPVERVELVRAVLRQLDLWLRRIEAGQYSALHKAWVGRCGMIQRRVSVLCAGRRHVGVVLDVSPLEGLILSCDSGQLLRLPAELSTIVS